MATCKHPTCGSTCRRALKQKKIYQLKRTPIKRSQKRIAKESKTRAAINRLYEITSRIYRSDHPQCEINSPVCTFFTQGVHHLKGKATDELLLDQQFWMPACNACNGYVEDHSAWAYANGKKLSKFS